MDKQGASSRIENNDSELRMRTCEQCGVGLGTMPRGEYLERFVDGKESCPRCGKSAITSGERKVPRWLKTLDLSRKYDVASEDLIRFIRQGEFKYYESEEPTAGTLFYYLREEDVARRFAARV